MMGGGGRGERGRILSPTADTILLKGRGVSNTKRELRHSVLMNLLEEDERRGEEGKGEEKEEEKKEEEEEEGGGGG